MIRLPLPGEFVGPYRIIRLIGQGGMGAVYLAEQDSRQVAVKILTSAELSNRLRFEREAQIAASVDQHPNVVRVLGAGADPVPYICSEYIAGEGLDRHVENGPASLEDVLRWTEAIARATQHLHDRGLLHRDIKAANVLRRAADGEVLLTDFGLASGLDMEALTLSGEVLGTPYAMAPEQFQGDRNALSPATDVWALGVLLYELLCGQRPFQAQTAVALTAAISMNEIKPPSEVIPALPESVDVIVQRCLEKDPKQRYPSAAALADDLALLGSGGTVSAPLPIGRWLVKAALGIALLAIAGFVLWLAAANDRLNARLGEKETALRQKALELNTDFIRHLAGHLDFEAPASCSREGAVQAALAALEDLQSVASQEPNSLLRPRALARVASFRASGPGQLIDLCARLDGFRPPLPAGHGWTGRVRLVEASIALKEGHAKRARGLLKDSVQSEKLRQLRALAGARLKWDRPSEALSRLSIGVGSGPIAQLLRRGRAELRRKLFAAALSRGAREARVSEDKELSAARDLWLNAEDGCGRSEQEAWERWESGLSTELRRAEKLSEEQIWFISGLRSRSYREPSYHDPKLSPMQRQQVAEFFYARADIPRALYHYLKLQQERPKLKLPMILRPGALEAWLRKQFLLEQGQEDQGVCQRLMLEASRAGYLCGEARSRALSAFLRMGLLVKAVSQAPIDPYARLWRGLGPRLWLSPTFPNRLDRRETAKQSIKDLSFALEHPLPEALRGYALFVRARDRGYLAQSIEDLKPAWVDLLAGLKLTTPLRGYGHELFYELGLLSKLSPERHEANFGPWEAFYRERHRKTISKNLDAPPYQNAPLFRMQDFAFELAMSELERARAAVAKRFDHWKVVELACRRSLNWQFSQVAVKDIHEALWKLNRRDEATALRRRYWDSLKQHVQAKLKHREAVWK